MRNRLVKMQYLLFALLLTALTGCGATNSTVGQGATTPVTAKVVGLVSDNVTKLRLKVTGASIPTSTQDFDDKTKGTIEVYPGSDLIVSAYALDSTGAVLFEGFATKVIVKAGVPANVSINMKAPVVKATDTNCLACHDNTKDKTGQNVVADYKQSGHYSNITYTINTKFGSTNTGCAGCHGTKHNDASPAASGRCYECHGTVLPDSHAGNATAITHFNCDSCHKPHNTTQFQTGRCISCHAVNQDANTGNSDANYVKDNNNGVRAITGEFGKWSHHVTGVTLDDAHCVACHLEGKVVNGSVAIDKLKHMVDAKTHLRNADDDSEILWDPATPNYTNMDNFCLSCHDANGATSDMSAQIQGYINTNGLNATGKPASPSNPFGDTISNQYDKLQRPAVVDAKGQFATTNNSHHAVLGKKYSGRTRSGASRVITDVAGFTSNSSAYLPGARSTIYDAGKFQSDYSTLSPATGSDYSLGDDSVLHCGDCHTVGQFRAADADPGNRYNKAVIGAHGANNEYLLRNNVGTDERHQGAEIALGSSAKPTTGYTTKPYLVCFNCHAFTTYGSIGASTGLAGLNHAGEYANSSRCNGPENTVFGNMTGEARLRSMITRTDATGTSGYGKKDGITTFGNAFGIQCANCHNSGITAGNIFGGIHGSKDQTYTDGMGNTTKHFRFMPGLGNIMYVPGTRGGVTGGNLAPYNSYSGNRNGTKFNNMTGQTFTQLPYRTIVASIKPLPVTTINGANVPSQVLKYNDVVSYSVGSGASAVYTYAPIATGSYQFKTGGATTDLNWEQISAQPVSGEYDFQAKSMGCYTLTNATTPSVPTGGNINKPNPNGTNSQAPATFNAQAALPGPDGTTAMFDNWGGCDDHGGNQGAGTAPFRKVLRKTSY